MKSGKIILLDIFSYSCMNCLRSLRFIKKIDKQYKKYGLETILVHPPEWRFEKDSNNILYILKKHKIKIPIVIDKNKKLIRELDVDFWPTQIVMDDGKILYRHVGEGNYKKLENAIRNILKAEPKRIFNREPEYSKFPPLYMGKRKKGRIVKRIGELRLGSVYTEGKWAQKEECLENKGAASLAIQTKGKIVNIVAKAIRDKPAAIFIMLGDKPLRRIVINRPDLYPLVRIKGSKQHTLTLMTKSKIAVYSFSFE